MEVDALDEYQLLDQIGAGAAGSIYRARKKDTQQFYALKLLAPGVSRNQLVVRRFEREMLILSKLHHSNIVAYYGGGEHEGQLFYVMELIEGGTLKQLLQAGGAFTWQETAECGRQIASALQHAHNHGIIHRDLKPGNIFFTPQGQVKLGDFGIAKDLTSLDLTDAGLTVGTYAYMAPELVRGQREITGNVDLYALGCLLFEMLTGRPPFPGDHFAQIFEQHLHADPPRVRQYVAACPAAIEALIVQLLAKDPHDRPFNARTVQGILGELQDTRAAAPRTSNGSDRAAAAVRPVQATLIDRIRAASESREVSWTLLGLIGLAIALGVAAAAWFPGH